MLTQEELKHILNYCPDTGVFTWKSKTSKKTIIGSVAGSVNWCGYILIGVKGNYYRAHRLAWVYMNGDEPSGQIDHINLVKDDNRWCNLRLASNSQNNMNRKANKTNVLGLKNISKLFNKYVVRIISCGKLYKKSFYDLDDAILYSNEMRAKLHGEFSNS